VHDIADLESRGVAAVFIASAEFADAAQAQARALGVDTAHVLVAHPIQDRSDTELQALADGAVDEIVRAVTAEPADGEQAEG
jgi:hypothetical protein